MFIADILAIPYLFSHKNTFYIPLLIWFTNSSSYTSFLFAFEPAMNYQILGIINLISLVMVTKELLVSNDNPINP
jgi:hypothetical protein